MGLPCVPTVVISFGIGASLIGGFVFVLILGYMCKPRI